MDASATRPVIAIIDDDADVRETLSALMEASGFEPVAFQDSGGFKAAGSPQDFDLALIDLRLKGESGLTLAILYGLIISYGSLIQTTNPLLCTFYF